MGSSYNSRLAVLFGVLALIAGGSAVNSEVRQRDLARLATSQRLSSQARSIPHELDRSLLASLEARRAKDTTDARGALLSALLRAGQLKTYLHAPEDVSEFVFSPDGQTIAARSGTTVVIWDLDSGSRRPDGFIDTADAVASLAFSPDGQTLATAMASGSDRPSVLLWDPRSGRRVGELQAQVRVLSDLRFSPDGRHLFGQALAEDNTPSVVRWVLDGGRLQRLFAGDRRGSYYVAFSADGATAAIGGGIAESRSSITVTDLEGQVVVLRPSMTPTMRPFDLALSPDGNTLAVAGSFEGDTGNQYSIRVWTTGSDDPVATVRIADRPGAGLAFSPDGGTLAAASTSSILLWDIGRRPVPEPFVEFTNGVTSLVFSPDGRTLAAAGADSVVVWDVKARRPMLEPFVGFANGVTGLVFSPDGRTLAAGSADSVVLWEVDERPPLGDYVQQGGRTPVQAVVFNPDGRTLTAASAEWTFRWDLQAKRQQGEVLGYLNRPYTGEVTTVALSPDGKTVAAIGPGLLMTWDIANRRQHGERIPYDGDVSSVAFSPDGRTLALGTAREVILWRLQSGRVVGVRGRLDYGGRKEVGQSLAFSPDGKLLAATGSGSLTLWDVRRLRQVGAPLERLAGTGSVAFSADGKLLAAADGRSVTLWDVRARHRVGRPLDHVHDVTSVAFSPDGKLLATADASGEGRDGEVWLWDLRTQQPLAPALVDARAPIFSLRFSSDGKVLAGTGFNETIVWDANRWAESACAIANRNFSEYEWTQLMGSQRYRRSCSGLPPP